MSILNPNPYPVIQGLDGLPLEDGYVYIGDANVDPFLNPKDIFWDEAQLFPASQPQRTSAGRFFNNGAIALVYVTGNYSIRVLDRNGSQVYLALNVTPI